MPVINKNESILLMRIPDHIIAYKVILNKEDYFKLKEDFKDYNKWRRDILMKGMAPSTSYTEDSTRYDLLAYYDKTRYKFGPKWVYNYLESPYEYDYEFVIFCQEHEGWEVEDVLDDSGKIIDITYYWKNKYGKREDIRISEFFFDMDYEKLDKDVNWVDEFDEFVMTIVYPYDSDDSCLGWSLLPTTEKLVLNGILKTKNKFITLKQYKNSKKG